MGILFGLFGAGRMPAAVKDEIEGERVLFQAEGVRVSQHRSGHVPGSTVVSGVRVGLGAFVVTDRRIVGSRGRAKWVDVPYEMATGGSASFTLDATGLHVRFDLDAVHPETSGEMRLDFRAEVPETALAGFPHREGALPVDPQKVVRLFGSLRKLPDQ